MRALDLYSGGVTRGLQDAGFYVIGVDIREQPNYCGDEFVRGDALEFPRFARDVLPLSSFDIAWASPPCQHYANVTRWRGDQAEHPALIEPTRALLEASGLPYVIESVNATPLRDPFMLCGSSFGLRVKRHRFFETNWLPFALVPPCGSHLGLLPFMHKGERAYADAMGCEWMTNREGRQAIPPAFSEWIGTQFVRLGASEAAA